MPKRKWARNVYLDYNSISLRLDALASQLRDAEFDALVIVLRGGSFAGIHIAFLTGLPIHFLRYHRPTETVEWVGEPPEGERVLVCEDSAGKGRTLVHCRDFVAASGYEVSTLVVCKMPLSAVTPDYCCFDWQDDDARVLFPWNRFRINGESIGDDQPDHAYERKAWDLDGVFLDDVEPHLYKSDLAAALSFRDNVPLAAFAPKPSSQDIVITSRPACDRERTEAWLRKYNIHIPLVMRDDGVESPSHESKARWKGARALELGFTHFVESHAEQAAYLAHLYPELRVIWWNQGNPLAIQAAPIDE